MEILGGLISTWLPTNYCSIEVEDDGKKLTAKVGDVGQVSSEVLENESGDAMTVQNAGFALAFQFEDAKFKIAPSDVRMSDPEMPRPIQTASGGRGTYHWAVG